MAERAPFRPPATTERPLGERDRAAIREDFAEGPLTGEERRFADLLAWEAQARADGADPRTLAALAKARRAAGRACHPAGLANDPAGLAHDPAGLAHDPAGLAHDPAGLAHDPAGLANEGAGPPPRGRSGP